MDRSQISDLIYKHLKLNFSALKTQFESHKHNIPYFYVDNLLPEDLALKLYREFPEKKDLVHNKSLRENKYVGYKMNAYHPILEECIYAFQDKKVVKLVSEICSLKHVVPDANLYAGGISAMGKGQFLNPHLDNSHDKDRNLWRVLNLLYYVTPSWKENYGGNLELWPNGLGEEQLTIHSQFNRLVVMATHDSSLHSVSPVQHSARRCCVSNYYFSKDPFRSGDTFHVTSFRGRPNEKFKDTILLLDTNLRMMLRKLFKRGVIENPHVYKKDKD